MMKKIAVGATLLCAAGFTQAAVITDSDSVAVNPTINTKTFVVDMFNDMGGNLVLDSVMLTLSGVVEGDARVENGDAGPAMVTANISAAVTLENMSSMVVLSANPVVSDMFSLAAFDNTIDFAGPSGAESMGLSNTFTTSTTYTLPVDLASFIGMGTISYNFEAVGSSNSSGAGTLFSQLATRAGGELLITYNYTDNTPPPVTNVSAPSSVALLGLSLLGVAGLRRKAKK
jgi:hypothetical protein